MAYVDPTVACSPWITEDKLCCEDVPDEVDCEQTPIVLDFKWTNADLIAAVSNILFRRTCYRYPGICTRSVIPCICGESFCQCGRYEPTITLTSDYPIFEIVEIREVTDGVTVILDPSVYRLDEHSRVVRLDGNPWPMCFTDVEIDYTTGRMPPIELVMAAGELVCELKKACNGQACKLPSHVRSVARRGVEITVWDTVALLERGLTGNVIVDHALSIHGVCGRSEMFDATRVHPAKRLG